ncbi:NAD(P)H-dependent flavin oxidoreductase [Aeromicrobium sp. UC242_57]|uniref:NAD(P)H-dependent flavin oxidoreductase n=1 Tax=Aeromicrobium sp. UC242_57 TaxID=3374624 RepID=UPI00379BD611
MKEPSGLLAALAGRLALPVIGSPMFIASGPELVIAQCTAGVVGTMPTRSVRDPALLGSELDRISAACADFAAAHPGAPVAPFGVNLVMHRANDRFEHDLETVLDRQVPLVITSLGPSASVVDAVHAYGGHVLHDVVSMRHARKAIAEGVDGLILVCNGAGGHAGSLSPFALLRELRFEYDGPVVLAGGISDGFGVYGALAMGADLAYVGFAVHRDRRGGCRS